MVAARLEDSSRMEKKERKKKTPASGISEATVTGQPSKTKKK